MAAYQASRSCQDVWIGQFQGWGGLPGLIGAVWSGRLGSW